MLSRRLKLSGILVGPRADRRGGHHVLAHPTAFLVFLFLGGPAGRRGRAPLPVHDRLGWRSRRLVRQGGLPAGAIAGRGKRELTSGIMASMRTGAARRLDLESQNPTPESFLEEIQAIIHSGTLRGAREVAERGLALYPEHPELRRLHHALRPYEVRVTS